MAESKFGAYTNLTQLASGGMAEIYLARQDSVGGFARQVVVKRIHSHLSSNPRFVAMFLDEARLFARMSHPNIATVFDFGLDKDAYCLIMEYVDGVTLAEALRQSRGIEPGHALRIASEICAGLHYAHGLTDEMGRSLHVVHRDVNPQNVLISFDGAVKLIDFGIAKHSFSTDRTRPGAVKGKYAYMAPEHITGKPVDHRFDQHAVGIILWEMLTGQRLFYRGNIHASLQAVLQETPAPIAAFQPTLAPICGPLDQVIAKTLQKSPDDRYENCAVLQNILDDLAFELRLRSSATRFATYLRGIYNIPERTAHAPPATSPYAASNQGSSSSVDSLEESYIGGSSDSSSDIAFKSTARIQALVDDDEASTLVESVEDFRFLTPESPPTERSLPTTSEVSTASITRSQFRRALQKVAAEAFEFTGLGQEETNLVAKRSRIIGRQADLESLHRIVSRGHRLVTVHGPAGVGKSRIAAHYGFDHIQDFSGSHSGGVWFCDLTEASSLEEVCFEMARVLQVPLLSSDSKVDSVVQISHAIIARGRALFILDSFEHVASIANVTVGKWLDLAPDAHFLVTSRDRLGLLEEAVYELYPLSMKKREGADSNDLDLSCSDAVQLFVERARAARRDFELTKENLEIIVEIVEHLDGLPLALELAAARMSVLTPQKLLERLRSSFEVLSRGSSGELDRQTTLRGAIDWSWSLLEEWEKVALAQLSVFVGGFDAEAAESVIDLSEVHGAPPVLDVVQSLGDKSLVRTMISTEFPGELRLGLYESIREYTREKLGESGDEAGALKRHGAHYLDVCEPWAEGVGGREADRFLRLLALERDNLVAVLERSLSTGLKKAEDIAVSLRALLVLEPILRARGPHKRHRTWIERVMKATRALAFDAGSKGRETLDQKLMTRGYLARGEVRRTRKRSNESRNDFQRALEIARELQDQALIGKALVGLANIAQGQGRIEESVKLFQEALDIQRSARDRAAQGATLALLGSTKIWLSQLDEAQENLEDGLICLRESGAPRHEGFVLVALGALHFEHQEIDEARVHVEEALDVLDRAWEPRYRAEALMYMGLIEWETENIVAAHVHFNNALRLSRDVGDRLFEARYLALRSAVEACSDRPIDSRAGFEHAEAAALDSGSPVVVRFVDVLRGQLDLALHRRAAKRGDDDHQEQHLVKALERLSAAESKGPPDREHPEGTPSMTEVSDEVRIAVRLLRRELERV